MANPQQPELRRSEQVPALSPDAMEAELDARRDEQLSSEADHRPPETPEIPEQDQDQPDPEDFAEKLGIRSDEET